MRKIVVDGNELEVPDTYSVLQACEEAGAEIPRFCFHERLSVAGNCRMCLVEAVGAPKPIASCAFGVKDLRGGPNGEPPVIETRSPLVKKAREGVMEFLLINHPLDCPICDQGGECDLQDQAMYYGVDSSRYAENKRAVEDKYIGPLVKTIMTRCIHCTRCVRFTTEVAGVSELGATGRGEDMEITTYLEHAMSSEMQGNVIDLCPVGALTSRPYAFQARPWELTKTETIDVMDAIGSNIRVDVRGRDVLRIMPRLNEAVNEEWISDKTRFVWDGLKAQRLDQPYVRENGRLRPASWSQALSLVAEKLKSVEPSAIAGLAGELLSVEDQFAFKSFMTSMGVDAIESQLDGVHFDPALGHESYVFNSGLASVEDADAILIIGSNPRLEATVFNSRIRKRWRAGPVDIGVIGEVADLTFDYDYLGQGAATLSDVVSGTNRFSDKLKNAERPMIILGQGALFGDAGNEILKSVIAYANDIGAVSDEWVGFNVLQTQAGRVGALMQGLTTSQGYDGIRARIKSGDIEIVYNFSADEIDTDDLADAFVIYQGSHGDRGAHRADVILPGAAYTEKAGIFVNTEGRVQHAQRASFPPGDAREDWSILRALSGMTGQPLSFDSFAALRTQVIESNSQFAGFDQQIGCDVGVLAGISAGKIVDDRAFSSNISNYYLTNPIARASKVMAECTELKNTLYMAAE